MKNPPERELYPVVQRWMKKHLLCFKVECNRGRPGRPDVVGVRDMGGEFSGEVQTIAIEVKKEGPPFLTMCGQTLAYTVYANRVYLAQLRKRVFTMEQKDIASHLGIGLIQIQEGKCHETISSPFYTPMTRLNLDLLRKHGLGLCQWCGSFFETGNPEDFESNLVGREAKYTEAYEAVPKAFDEDKGLMFWNQEVAERESLASLR
jgi:hypothetical protein